MIFASNLFLLYFLPVFLLVYWLVPYAYRNGIALLGSLLFYAWGAPLFVFILLASSAFDYLLSRGMQTQKRKRELLALGILSNLGLLLYFKYVNFFIDNWNALLSGLGFVEVEWTAVVIPLGISFFTFQKISYLVDISRGVKTPPQNPLNYLLYVSFFPQLVAGPIVRYNEIADQIQDRRSQDNLQLRWSGAMRFCLGLGRKVLIANPLAIYVQSIVSLPQEELTPGLAWLAPFIFAFVVYHDFGGYSDMAIGLGRMLGFRIRENFNHPYTSASITEFWKRWHISLTGWFRSYLFYPLRRFAKAKWILSFNLWLVFALVGFWHGASWTFVLFGVWHGSWILVEHHFTGQFMEKVPRMLSVPWTFFIVVVGIVPFISPSMSTLVDFYQAMLGWSGGTEGQIPLSSLQLDFKFWFILVLAALFSFWGLVPKVKQVEGSLNKSSLGATAFYLASAFAFLILVLSVGELARMGFQPFIYFMF